MDRADVRVRRWFMRGRHFSLEMVTSTAVTAALTARVVVIATAAEEALLGPIAAVQDANAFVG